MTQLHLFPTHPDSEATAAPVQRHSPTSVAAAEAIEPKAGKLHHRVYRHLHESGNGKHRRRAGKGPRHETGNGTRTTHRVDARGSFKGQRPDPAHE